MTKISVVIPAFNADKFLGEALESVFKQTIIPDEIIVVDDGSTDQTVNIAKSFPKVSYLYQSNRGTASAINTGVNHARGEFLAFLDADDLWMPDKLEKQFNYIEQNDSVDLVFTLLQNFLCTSSDAFLREKIEFNSMPMIGIQKSTMFIRREVFFKIGLLDPSSGVDLLDWYARSKEMNIVEHVIEEVLVKRRIHGNNQSLVNKVIRNDFPKVLKNILDRRRSLK